MFFLFVSMQWILTSNLGCFISHLLRWGYWKCRIVLFFRRASVVWLRKRHSGQTPGLKRKWGGSGFLHFRLIGNSCSVSTGMVLGPNLLRKEEWFKVLVKMQIPGHKPGFCRALHQIIGIFFWVPQVVLKNTEIWESQLGLLKNEGLEWMSILLSVFTHPSVSLRLNIQINLDFLLW